MANLYCRLFVDCALSREQLTKQIASIVCGQTQRFTVSADWGEVDIRENDDWDETRTDQQDGFLYYRFSNDIEPRETTDRESYVAGVRDLIKGLRARGCKVVPACDFENEVN